MKKKELAKLWGMDHSRFQWKPGDIQPVDQTEEKENETSDDR